MALVVLRVDLPSYSRSFLIKLPISATISDVKQHLYKICTGNPRPDGQRIIWRGRILLDHESVNHIWATKLPDESPVVHLAVHPSAWSSSPPDIPQQPHTPLPFHSSQQVPHAQTHIPTPLYHPQPQQPQQHAVSNHTLAFIRYKHDCALFALLENRAVTATGHPDIPSSRTAAIHALESKNISWPSILDVEYPEPSPGGLQYERVIIEGKWYCLLRNPQTVPTPFQVHALKVLTHTFAILAIIVAGTQFTPFHPLRTTPPNINQILQQLGLPPVRLPENVIPIANPIIPRAANREIPFRPLIAPLAMLLVRTLLLLYFVAPARKPMIAIVLFGWVIYEAWGPIREGLRRGMGGGVVPGPNPNLVGRGGNPQPAGQPFAPAPGEARVQQVQIRRQPHEVRVNAPDNQATMLLENLAHLNLQKEEQAIQPVPGTEPPQEPGIIHKMVTFVALLMVTMHPAVWNRRRSALRQREGRLRTEASAREERTEDVGEHDERREQVRAQLIEQHGRRPPWVQRYIERVRNGDHDSE